MLNTAAKRIALIASVFLLTLASAFVGVQVADASARATLHSVSATTLCKSFKTKNVSFLCASGYANSSGKLVKYQAKMKFNYQHRETIMVAKKSSCKNAKLTFWGNDTDSTAKFSLSIESVSGTTHAISHRTAQATVTSPISRGPFYLKAYEYNYEDTIFLTGSANCYTVNGK